MRPSFYNLSLQFQNFIFLKNRPLEKPALKSEELLANLWSQGRWFESPRGRVPFSVFNMAKMLHCVCAYSMLVVMYMIFATVAATMVITVQVPVKAPGSTRNFYVFQLVGILTGILSKWFTWPTTRTPPAQHYYWYINYNQARAHYIANFVAAIMVTF